MVKIFLDTNHFLDVVWRDPQKGLALASDETKLYISVLSVHIYAYSAKIRLPDENFVGELNKFILLSLNEEILNLAVKGPTSDLEDNIQLHSAAQSGCDYFLTNDKALLKMRFFGKTEILAVPKTNK